MKPKSPKPSTRTKSKAKASNPFDLAAAKAQAFSDDFHRRVEQDKAADEADRLDHLCEQLEDNLAFRIRAAQQESAFPRFVPAAGPPAPANAADKVCRHAANKTICWDHEPCSPDHVAGVMLRAETKEPANAAELDANDKYPLSWNRIEYPKPGGGLAPQLPYGPGLPTLKEYFIKSGSGQDAYVSGLTAEAPAVLLPGEEVSAILKAAADLSDKKRADYAGTDPDENFTRSAKFAGLVCKGLDDLDRRRSTATLIGVKLARLANLGLSGNANNEAVEDTLVDLINYFAILKRQCMRARRVS